MSQNQSYFWQTTKRNVFLKRSARLHMLLALLAVLTFSTICQADTEPRFIDQNANSMGVPTKLTADEQKNGNGIAPFDAANEIPNTETTKENAGNNGFIDAFTASISVILFTELGDKTFFIAAIMAMRHPRLIVFAGAIGALAFMTILSVVFGMVATLIPRVYTYYISTALFAIFGLKMIYEGYFMKASDAQEELEEVQSDLRKREDELLRGKYDENEAKRKNSNSDKEGDSEGVERGAGVVSSTNSNNARASEKNPEMQHRQRKQPNYMNSANANINSNNHNNNVCDEQDDSGNECTDSDVFLPGGEALKMSTFHSSPAISSIASSQKTEQTNIDEFNNSPSIKRSNNNNNNNNNNVGNNKSPMVHSTSATATLVNKNGHVGLGTSNHSISSISSLNANATAGQSVGELKQISGSKKRLERDVTATLVQDPESGVVRKSAKKSAAYLTTRVFIQAFTMTFLAEWGDRSQLTTVILAASKNVYGVIAGGIIGHSICTGLAVIGGRMVAAKISVRTVTIVGGIVFLGFALYALIVRPDDI